MAKWMPQMRRACSRQIVLDQLDQIAENYSGQYQLCRSIAQIKEDVANIQPPVMVRRATFQELAGIAQKMS